MEKLEIKLLSKEATVPTRSHSNDAGLDLYSAEDVIINPGQSAVIKTNVAINLEDGYEAQIRPRSGISSKTALRVVLGTVDAGYTGDLGVMADNTYIPVGTESCSVYNVKGEVELNDFSVPDYSFKIKKGDKIAQLVVVPISLPAVEVVEEFDKEETRSDKGFGSTDEK